MSTSRIAVYAEGYLYPDPANPRRLEQTVNELQGSGITTAILGLMHIGRDYDISPAQIPGDLYFNEQLVFSNGDYAGDPHWPDVIAHLIGGSVSQVCLSIGGGGVLDYQTLQKIYAGNNNSFDGTNLERNLLALRKVLPDVSVIDLDIEETYNPASTLAFCQKLHQLGFGITFCPYTLTTFWTDLLAELEACCPGAVHWWNLQCYDGGGGNNPQDWQAAIQTAVPGFNTDGFIVVGDWVKNDHSGRIVSPQEVCALLAPYVTASWLGGAFLWTLDEMVERGPGTAAAYAAAIAATLQR